jgi:hypothetical protein
MQLRHRRAHRRMWLLLPVVLAALLLGALAQRMTGGHG